MLVFGLCGAAGVRADGAPQDWERRTAGFSEKVDALVSADDRPYTPGAIIAVIKGREVIHLRGYGRANREMDVKWSNDTRYRMASVSKSFMTHLTLLLVDEGVIQLADPIGKYLSDAPQFMAKITIEQLLTNTSGLRLDELLINLAGQKGFVTLDDMWEMDRRQGRLDYVPGTYQNYTDTNWRVLTLILERRTGRTLEELLRSRIFGPLGMQDSTTAAYYRQMLERQATTYEQSPDGTYRRREIAHPSSGDGAVISSMRDMVKWTV